MCFRFGFDRRKTRRRRLGVLGSNTGDAVEGKSLTLGGHPRECVLHDLFFSELDRITQEDAVVDHDRLIITVQRRASRILIDQIADEGLKRRNVHDDVRIVFEGDESRIFITSF